jgi:hypothetical protein
MLVIVYAKKPRRLNHGVVDEKPKKNSFNEFVAHNGRNDAIFMLSHARRK